MHELRTPLEIFSFLPWIEKLLGKENSMSDYKVDIKRSYIRPLRKYGDLEHDAYNIFEVCRLTTTF